MRTESISPKGVKKQIFGSVLFFLGGLNMLFSVKGGFTLDGFYLILILAGAFIFAYGALQRAPERVPKKR